MAAVANCPQCEHELLVPEETDVNAWAKCPACRAFFQLRDSIQRDIAAVELIDDDVLPPVSTVPPAAAESNPGLPATIFGVDEAGGSIDPQPEETAVEPDRAGRDTIVIPRTPNTEDILGRYQRELDRFEESFSSTPTSDELDPARPAAGAEPDAPETSVVDEVDEQTPPTGDADANIATQGIERWFRSAETVTDLPPLPPTPAFPLVPENKDREEGEQPSTKTVPRAAEPWKSETPTVRLPEVGKSWSDLLLSPTEPSEQDTGEEREPTLPAADDSASRPTLADSLAAEMPVESLTNASGGVLDLSADEEIEPALADREAARDPFATRPTWDDAEQMESLLADVEPPGGDWRLEEAGPHVDEHEHEHEDDAASADNDTAIHDMPPIVAGVRTARRRRSPAMFLASTIIGGLFGLALGYYVLLWLLGREGDFLQAGRYLPRAILPASFQASTGSIAESPHAPLASSEGEIDLLPEQSTREPAGPAEVTASYEAPLAPPPESSFDQDERYGTSAEPVESPRDEPFAFEEPSALPLSAESSVVRIVNAPIYSSEELSAGLREAREAQSALLHGRLSDKEAQRAKGLSYTKFCQLADFVTFLDSADLSDDADEAAALFRETLAENRVRDEVGYIASKWIDSPHRRMGGIFLAGNVTGQSSLGELARFQVDLGTGPAVTVVAPASLASEIGPGEGSVAIAGSVIDDPANRIPGYSGDEEQIVWAGALIPLD